MRTFLGILLTVTLVFTIAILTNPDSDLTAQGPTGSPTDMTPHINRMMSFDANKDGRLTKEEVTDPRLASLFERADANSDGVVTKDELKDEFTKLSANLGNGFPGGGGFPGGPGGRPGGPGGPGGRGPGGPGMGGPPPIGQVLSEPVQGMLRLTDAQKKDVAALQKHVDEQLAKILTKEQRQQLDEMKSRGPGGPGFGPPGREGGPGGRPGR